VTVNDVAPTIASVVAFPNVLTPPNKKLDPSKLKAVKLLTGAQPLATFTDALDALLNPAKEEAAAR
jgi:hypothetical protein